MCVHYFFSNTFEQASKQNLLHQKLKKKRPCFVSLKYGMYIIHAQTCSIIKITIVFKRVRMLPLEYQVSVVRENALINSFFLSRNPLSLDELNVGLGDVAFVVTSANSEPTVSKIFQDYNTFVGTTI